MNSAADFDLIDLDRLRALGGLKWSMFPDTIGAFVAEMDFGTAPASPTRCTRLSTQLFGYLPSAWPHVAGVAADGSVVYDWDVAADVHPLPT